jgi:hypothetical protein
MVVALDWSNAAVKSGRVNEDGVSKKGKSIQNVSSRGAPDIWHNCSFVEDERFRGYTLQGPLELRGPLFSMVQRRLLRTVECKNIFIQELREALKRSR